MAGPFLPGRPAEGWRARVLAGYRSWRRWSRRRRSIVPTREGWVFLGMMLAVALAAANTGNNLLYLVFATMLALLGTSGVLSELAIQAVRVERRFPEAPEAGRPARGTLTITNLRARMPNLLLRVREAVQDSDAELARGADVTIPLLRAGETQEIGATWQFVRRGRHRLHAVRVSTTWPFGIFEKRYDLRAPQDVLVVPAPQRDDLPPEGGLRDDGAAPAARSGRAELRELRVFRPGDDPRAIHWRASARAGQTMAAEREGDGGEAIAIALDAGGARADVFERALRVASAALVDARFARVELHAGQRVLASAAGDADRRALRLRLSIADAPDGQVVLPEVG
jgi:uncharacterized protein (DUF58 family)